VTVNLAITTAQATGGAGSDGLSGFENLTGSALDDTLIGTTGANTIIGGDGADTIRGGRGADFLTGGQDADKFVFTALADSAPGARDLITDFVHAWDTIDFSAIDANTSISGNQAFLFGGQNASVVPRSVTWFESDGNTIVQADVNGNSTADLVIVLTGVNHHLTEADFFL
jgi:Ca2+-binding RTX toxin-like protein